MDTLMPTQRRMHWTPGGEPTPNRQLRSIANETILLATDVGMTKEI